MKVVESYDSHLNTVWKVLDGWQTIAICYSQTDAEVCKAALEKHRAEKEAKEKSMW